MTRVMKILVALASAFTICIVAADTTKKDCSNGTECCANYIRRDDGLCHPCENGTYGVKCSLRCPRFYYGRFCERTCNCSGGFDCDPRNGKCDYDETGDNGSFQIWIIVLASIGVIVLFLGLLGCCLAFQRSKQLLSNNKDMPTVHDLIDLLARQAFSLESESNNYRGTTTPNTENSIMPINNDTSYHYIDTSQLDINPTTSNVVPRLEIVEPRMEERSDHYDHESDSNIPVGKAWSGSHTLPAATNYSPFLGAVEMYYSIENLTSGYDTLTRCGPQKADVPPSSGFLKRKLEHWNTVKPKGLVKVRKFRNKQREATDDNSQCKVERRRKSRALSNIRKGIRSVFRSSKASLELKSNENDGSNRDVYRYSVVQPTQDTCSTDGNLMEEGSSEDRNINTDHCNIRNESVGNIARAACGPLPPPPDEWLSENCSARLCDGSHQENDDEQTENNKINDTKNLNHVSDQAVSTIPRKHLLQKCHITQFAVNNEST